MTLCWTRGRRPCNCLESLARLATATRPVGRAPSPIFRLRRDEAGKAVRFPGVVIEVTDRKRAEEALDRVTAESERRTRLYEAVLSTTPDLAYVWGLDHRFTYANEGLLRMWGKTWDEAIGKTCLELGYEPWHAEMHDREIDEVRATRKPLRGEVPFAGTFGRRIYDYILVPVIGADGEVEAVAGTTRDVTDRKEMEQELRDQDRKKDDFIALLAHELRNPLAPIRNGLSVLRLAGADREAARTREHDGAPALAHGAADRRPARRLADQPQQDGITAFPDDAG